MFIRRYAFENLVKRCERQQQEIEKLSEMVGILAKSRKTQFEVNFEKDWKVSDPGRDEHINACCQEPLLPDWSF